MKVYVVIQVSDDGYDSCFNSVFLDEKKADKYIELQEAISEGLYRFYKREEETQDDNVDLKSTTAKYYNYYYSLDKDDEIKEEDLLAFAQMDEEEYKKLTPEQIKQKLIECNHPDQRWINDPKETQVCVDNGDKFVERTEDHVTVYSKISFEDARSTALNLWKYDYENRK